MLMLAEVLVVEVAVDERKRRGSFGLRGVC
jgi:hypothetical protein